MALNQKESTNENVIIRDMLLKYKEYRKMDDITFLQYCRRYSQHNPAVVVEALHKLYGALPYNAYTLVQEEAGKFVDEYEKIL